MAQDRFWRHDRMGESALMTVEETEVESAGAGERDEDDQRG